MLLQREIKQLLRYEARELERDLSWRELLLVRTHSESKREK